MNVHHPFFPLMCVAKGLAIYSVLVEQAIKSNSRYYPTELAGILIDIAPGRCAASLLKRFLLHTYITTYFSCGRAASMYLGLYQSRIPS